MQKHNTNQSIISREAAIHRYILALDQGDMEGVAQILEAALDDPELERLITEINLAYQEEEQITPIATDAQLVRDLLHKHFKSAFETEEVDFMPLTVGEVAARLQADRRVLPADQEANRILISSSVPLPKWLSLQAVKELAAQLGVKTSDRFWRTFRDTAIMLSMGRSHSQAQLAAREEKVRYQALRDKPQQTSNRRNKNTKRGKDI
jgi:DNA-binding phage protein